MYSNRFTAVVDACSLADVAKRDLLLTLAEAGLYRLRWSEKILMETEGAIGKILQERTDGTARASKAVAAMRTAFPEAAYCDYARVQVVEASSPPRDRHLF